MCTCLGHVSLSHCFSRACEHAQRGSITTMRCKYYAVNAAKCMHRSGLLHLAAAKSGAPLHVSSDQGAENRVACLVSGLLCHHRLPSTGYAFQLQWQLPARRSRLPCPQHSYTASAMSVKGQKVAVVGSGVSGLATAWLLQFHGAEVTVYESEETCGGHTLTDHSSGYPVDLGFQVYNLTTYPHFIGWMEHLGVESETSDMSFAISVDKGRLEWASHGLHSIFAQRKNIFDSSFLRMVWEVLRFGREAPEVLSEEKAKEYADVTLGQYLEAKKCAAARVNTA